MLVKLEVGDLKETRTMLVDLLWWYNFEIHDTNYKKNVARLESMISQIDLMRPLDSFGNHSDLHTPHCGCENVSVLYCVNCRQRIDKTTMTDGAYIWRHANGSTMCAVLTTQPTKDRMAQ